MKLDLSPTRPGYVVPTFGSHEIEPLDPRLERRLRRPMVVGGTIIGTLVVGLIVWASFTPLASGVTAPGEVQVESNLKTLRHHDGGVVSKIFVKEGQSVRANQPLIILDDTTARSAFDVMQNQADILWAQSARADAEATNKDALAIPPELSARLTDSRVAGLVRDQEFLFTQRLALQRSQTQVLEQRIEQAQNQIDGDQAQIDATQDQIKLTQEEMAGYQTLYDKGYAPKSLILRYERSVSELVGHKAALVADVARLRQQMGETRMQMVSLQNQRQTQGADDMKEAQAKLADVMPRLTAAKQTLDGTTVRAPVDGYVFNLTQYTPGAAVGAGEVLMQLVPSNAPMLVSAMVKPQDIGQVRAGMKARVQISGLNPRWHGPMNAKVLMVAPDKSSPPPSASRSPADSHAAPSPLAMGFYRVDVQIEPKELTKLKTEERITPGMPATVMLVSGKRTLMSFLVSPITDTLDHAFREQ
jgi:HlyD family type I secretion membrane fusion protein